MSKLTHFNRQGDVHMVDVGDKDETHRVAIAGGAIHMLPATLQLILAGEHKKGDVLGIARVAGIMGAKKTADLIPLCHPLPVGIDGQDFTLCHVDDIDTPHDFYLTVVGNFIVVPFSESAVVREP